MQCFRCCCCCWCCRHRHRCCVMSSCVVFVMIKARENTILYSLRRKIWRVPVYHTSTHTLTGGGKKVLHSVWNFNSMLILPFVLSWLSILKGYPHASLVLLYLLLFFIASLQSICLGYTYFFQCCKNLCPSKSSLKMA